MDQGEKYEEEVVEVMDNTNENPKVPKKLIFVGTTIVIVGVIIAGSLTLYKSGKVPKTQDTKGQLSQAAQESMAKEQGNNNILAIDYSDKDKETLRANGYTGPEIESASQAGKTVVPLVAKAKALREEELKKTYIELNDKVKDSASDEFKSLLESTWLGGKPITVTPPTNNNYSTKKVKFNASYVKIPPKGNQLFIRLIIEDGSYVFMNIHPDRWYKLRDAGNMVITYDEVTYGTGKYILNILEVPI